jgi:hypothetical protein
MNNLINDQIFIFEEEIKILNNKKKALHFNIINNIPKGDDLILTMKYMHSYNNQIIILENKIKELEYNSRKN